VMHHQRADGWVIEQAAIIGGEPGEELLVHVFASSAVKRFWMLQSHWPGSNMDWGEAVWN
jgi:hypothetical protein